MRNIILKSVSVFLIGFLFFLTNAVADERMKTIEMVDGNTISYPMSSKEIALADAEAARAKATKNSRNVQPKKWVTIIEQPESGNYIEFPMTNEEIKIAIEKAEQDKSDTNRRTLNAYDDRKEKGEVFEMGDGHAIAFYKNKPMKWGPCPF